MYVSWSWKESNVFNLGRVAVHGSLNIVLFQTVQFCACEWKIRFHRATSMSFSEIESLVRNGGSKQDLGSNAEQ